jgi:hypothetical protein
VGLALVVGRGDCRGQFLISTAFAGRSESGSPVGMAAPERRNEPMLESIVYLIFCVLTGLCGIERRMGFFGTFLLAIVTTPLVVLPVLLLTGPSRRMEWHRRT